MDELEVFTAGPIRRTSLWPAAGTKATASGTLPGVRFTGWNSLNDGRYGNSMELNFQRSGSGWVRMGFPAG